MLGFNPAILGAKMYSYLLFV